MFIGRSLMTGRAVCLLFLPVGRVTRSVPSGGLEHFDWHAHKADHPGDSGAWQVEGGVMTVIWGDGGINQGPLTVLASGIEFYGKRYSRPRTVGITDLAGRWEAASGTALGGGEGINRLSTLTVDAGGSYRRDGAIGGVVDGLASAEGSSSSGTLAIVGQTLTFSADDGSSVARTFLPAAGEPLDSFSLDADMFTRLD